MAPINEWTTIQAREDFSRLLAACYYQPEAQLGTEDVFGSLALAGDTLDPSLAALARILADDFHGETIDALLADYSRLFLGPFTIPAKPYGSVWLEGPKTAMGDSTMAVLDLYRQGGFELSETFRELPDHIAVELEFLYLLNFKDLEARRSGESGVQTEVALLRQSLLRHHLGRWVGPFTAAMKASAETPFYKTLAELTSRYVEMELHLERG